MITDEMHLEALMTIKALLVEHEGKIAKLEKMLEDVRQELKQCKKKDPPFTGPTYRG